MLRLKAKFEGKQEDTPESVASKPVHGNISVGGDDLQERVAALEAELASVRSERDVLSDMIEQMPVNVMSCDLEEFKIDYANKSTMDTLKSIEHVLPIAAADQLDICIDVFHKVPETHVACLRTRPICRTRAKFMWGRKFSTFW